MASQVRGVLDDITKQNKKDVTKGPLESKPKTKGFCCFWIIDEPRRGNWKGRLEFVLSCLGFCIGLGDVWRFPYLCYKNGGAAFFIPFIFFLVFTGMPLILVEFALGQFCSRGVLNCWGYVPLFRGLGLGMLLLSAMIAIYHNALVGYSLFYFVKSMASELPWARCQCKSSPYCTTRLLPVSLANCTKANGLTAFTNNGTCYDSDGKLYGIFNGTLAVQNNIRRTLPASDFFDREGFMTGVSKGIDDLGDIRWDLAICLLAAWALVFFILIAGIKSMGKVAYVMAVLALVLIVLLTIVGGTSTGAGCGMMFLRADFARLKDLSVWCEAAIAVFYLMGVCWGGLITLASFNRFHTDIIRYSILVPLISLGFYVLTAIMFFSFFGVAAKKFGADLGRTVFLDNINSSVVFAFILVPQGIAAIPGSVGWSILYFLLLIVIGLSTVVVLVLTIVTALTDCIRRLRGPIARVLLLLVCCVVLFLLGLTMATVGGLYMLQLMDDYVIWWSVPVLALLLLLSFAVYGPLRLARDVEVMLRKSWCGCIPWPCCKWVWMIGWLIFAPITIIFAVVVCLIHYMPSRLRAYVYPGWANTLGWLMTISILVVTIVAILVCAAMRRCRCRELLNPTRFWGPSLLKNRKHITYAEGFVVDPKENQEVPENMRYNAYDNSDYDYINGGAGSRTSL